MAVGAVLHGAQHALPLRVGGGFHQGLMPRRAGKLHRRIDGDTAGIRRRANHLPAAARFFHFHHRHAHRVLPLTGFVEVPVRHTVRKQHPVIDVFMVQRQQTMFRVLLPCGRLNHAIPSWCIPACTACSSVVLLASGLNAGMWSLMPVGSPQR